MNKWHLLNLRLLISRWDGSCTAVPAREMGELIDQYVTDVKHHLDKIGAPQSTDGGYMPESQIHYRQP